MPAVYKPPVRPEDDVLPPPPFMSSYPDENFPPPPPPPELVRGHAYIDRNDSYPLPPPPASHEYDPKGPAIRTTSYAQQTSYGGMSNPREIFVTAPSGYSRGDSSQPNYVNQTDIHPSGRSVAPPPNSMPNYANVHNTGAAAAAASALNPALPSHTYSPITPNATSAQYTAHPVVPSNPGGYGQNTSRSPLFESSAPLPKSDEQGTLTRKSGKEAEVDALTNLLMQNIESAGDPDFFGKSFLMFCRF